MPTHQELSRIHPVDGDGSTTAEHEDGTRTTTWPDGTTRVDYPADGSAMVVFPDGAVLNTYADGSRTLHDASGAPLDVLTGGPLDGAVPPPAAYGAERVRELLEGVGLLEDPTEAETLLEAGRDALAGIESPLGWFGLAAQAALEGAKAFETQQRGCYFRGWAYTVVYRLLQLGTPPEPHFAGGFQQDPEQAALDRQGWLDGVAAAQEQLDGDAAFRNRVMLRFAYDGRSPTATLRALYQAACDGSGDWQLKEAYQDVLGWPDPTGA